MSRFFNRIGSMKMFRNLDQEKDGILFFEDFPDAYSQSQDKANLHALPSYEFLIERRYVEA